MMIQEGVSTPDDQLEVDGMLIQNVAIVGRLLDKSEEPMRTMYELSDNTQTFKVIFYKKGENEEPTALKNFQYKQGAWVKVKGTVRVFREDKAIVGNQIFPVVQHDEIVNHFLQVFVASNIRKKGVLTQNQITNARRSGVHAIRNNGGKPASDAPDVDLLFLMRQLMKRNNMKFIDKNSIM